MSRFGRLQALLRAASASCAPSEVSSSHSAVSLSQSHIQRGATLQFLQRLHTTPQHLQASDVAAADLGKSTGAERFELEAKAKGIDNPYHEDWLDAPFGTEDKPVQVTSSFAERVVGVPDPYDDSIIWWGKIEEGQAPKQIIEGGEFFVLKRIADEDPHGH